ncbi:MAG: hypothetical protein FJ315_07660 [SAR202 cluster bacterium]|nr:hypothetical protein [SAR202 cluster bacterium]
MRYKQAAFVYVAASALEILTLALVAPPGQLREEATFLLVALGFVVLFGLVLFNTDRWAAKSPLSKRTVNVLVFVLGANAFIRGLLAALNLLPFEVSLVIRTQEWIRAPVVAGGSGSAAVAVRACAEVCIAYAMGRALWGWPPVPKGGRESSSKHKAPSRHSSRA